MKIIDGSTKRIAVFYKIIPRETLFSAVFLNIQLE